jgi:four helix bundle protein
MRNDKENIIIKMTLDFALMIVEYAEILESKRKYVIAKQILKSGTSIGANVREAQNAESKKDFIHKLKIAAKEIDETFYWLEICKLSNSYPTNESLILRLEDINKVISKIISTTKKTMS